MKKLLAFAALFAVVALTSCKYDDDDLWNSVHGLENRVAKLEELCKQMNTNISSLQTIVTALQNNVYVTGTTPLMKDGKEIGYTITFSKGNPITIYHGKDGQDGEDGITPTISVKKDTDGVYYWTLNGEFIVVDGGKIQAEGKDGTNGTTPQFKIENDYWFVSYNNGANWTQLGKATGEDGIGGDSMFSGVDYETSTDYVIFTLSNGTQIKLPTWSAFEALQRLCNETNTNLSALQTIVTALQNNDYITSVDPLTENGKVVGYTIKFAKSNPIVIYNRVSPMEYKNIFEIEFIQRTQEIVNGYQIPFENTLFINACVGLLIIPQQSLFNHLPTEVVSADKWGIADTDISCIKEPNKSVKNVARHIRNAIAHDGIRFGSDNGKDITHIKITDWKDERHKTETFKAVIEVTKFKTFVWAFAQFALTQQSLFKSQN